MDSLSAVFEQSRIPGVAVVTVEHGQAAWSGGFGRKFAVIGDPVTADTVFHAASIGKTLAAYVALKMVGRGQLDLDRPLFKYLQHNSWARPEHWGDQITLRHVLTHTSGLNNNVAPPDSEVSFEPGTRYSYSGNGIYYLQQVLEAVSGKDIESLMRQEVFVPLGMTRSTYEPAVTVEDEAVPHFPLLATAGILLLALVAVSALFCLFASILRRIRTSRWGLSSTAVRNTVVFAAALISAIPGLLLGWEFSLTVACLLIGLVAALWIVRIVALALLHAVGRTGSNTKDKLVFGAVVLLLLAGLAVALRQQQVPVPPLTPTERVANAAYSLRTSATDLARFSIALLEGTGLRSMDHAALLSPQQHVSDSIYRTLGLVHERTPQGDLIWHGGQNPGYESILALFPERGTAMIVLTNGVGGHEPARQMVLSHWNISAELRLPAD